jgi:hypothetical protein
MAAARSFLAGKLPLWTPDLFAGAPLLANSQIGVFYPLNWPLWWLSGGSLLGVTRALHISVLLHLALAALTACVLARRVALHRGAQRWQLLYPAAVHGSRHSNTEPVAGIWLAALVLRRGKSAVSRFAFHVSRSFPSPISILALTLMAHGRPAQMPLGRRRPSCLKALDCVSWSLGNRYFSVSSVLSRFHSPIFPFLSCSLLPDALAPLDRRRNCCPPLS